VAKSSGNDKRSRLRVRARKFTLRELRLRQIRARRDKKNPGPFDPKLVESLGKTMSHYTNEVGRSDYLRARLGHYATVLVTPIADVYVMPSFSSRTIIVVIHDELSNCFGDSFGLPRCLANIICCFVHDAHVVSFELFADIDHYYDELLNVIESEVSSLELLRMLLFIGGVEQNPGPHHKRGNVGKTKHSSDVIDLHEMNSIPSPAILAERISRVLHRKEDKFYDTVPDGDSMSEISSECKKSETICASSSSVSVASVPARLALNEEKSVQQPVEKVVLETNILRPKSVIPPLSGRILNSSELSRCFCMMFNLPLAFSFLIDFEQNTFVIPDSKEDNRCPVFMKCTQFHSPLVLCGVRLSRMTRIVLWMATRIFSFLRWSRIFTFLCFLSTIIGFQLYWWCGLYQLFYFTGSFSSIVACWSFWTVVLSGSEITDQYIYCPALLTSVLSDVPRSMTCDYVLGSIDMVTRRLVSGFRIPTSLLVGVQFYTSECAMFLLREQNFYGVGAQ